VTEPIGQSTNLFSDKQWLEFILSETLHSISRGRTHVVLLGSGRLLQEVQQGLLKVASRKEAACIFVLDSQVMKIEGLASVQASHQHTVFVSCFTSNSGVKGSLQLVLQHPEFRYSEFIFKIRASDSYSSLVGSTDPYDRLETLFVSSVFDDSLIDDIYEFSLTKVGQKCTVKDAYDLYQLLLQTRNVGGAIAEFGSYQGHSGLIISEIVKRLRIQKQVYLCDTFDEFPTEKISVDRFWNDTHLVDYEAVKRIFNEYGNVCLVRGDFSRTIDLIPEDWFSLVYVDCDSYRATKLVSEKIYPKLNCGGVIVYEDYGHDFCLGARQAVDEFYKDRRDCLQFFSGFSGLQIAIKLSATPS
jgi:O-methyltransferase